MDKIRKKAALSFLANVAFSAYHVILGIVTHSWWFLNVGVYYTVLAVLRSVLLRSKTSDRFAIKFTGMLQMILSVPLIGTVILSFVKDRGTVYHLIVMLAIATYTFTKITLAIINWARSQKSPSAKLKALRNISLSEAFVSIFSLQRSMLVSFEGMSETEIKIMNLATGSGVCVIVFLLGLRLFKSKVSS